MDIIIEFARSIEGLLIAIVAIFTAIVGMMHELRMWIKWLTSKIIKKPPVLPVEDTGDTSKVGNVHPEKSRIPKKKILTTLLPLAFAATILGVRLAYPISLNTKLTNKAWHAYNKGNYESAMDYAEECIDEFKPAADNEQSKLKEQSVPPPPTGEVFDDDERREILRRGPLNDVATCYWIKGRSAEKLGLKEEARNAYKAAQNYPHGRCWDPKGWFWSPADDAEARLKYLEQ